jgi:hypothetical protein
MTYRSRGRSLIEVVLVRLLRSLLFLFVAKSIVSSVFLLFAICSHIHLFPILFRLLPLSHSLLDSSQSCALEITFERSGHRNGKDRDGWQSWPPATKTQAEDREPTRHLHTYPRTGASRRSPFWRERKRCKNKLVAGANQSAVFSTGRRPKCSRLLIENLIGLATITMLNLEKM